MADVTLGYPTLQDYVDYNSLAERRSARRGSAPTSAPSSAGTPTGSPTASSRSRGVTHSVPLNDGGNSLHGGFVGFDQQVWTPTELRGGAGEDASVGLQLEYLSPNASEGYPGNLDTIATYTLNNRNQLQLSFHATTDMPTVLNLTNHTYWNLAGEASGPVYDQTMSINAGQYTPVSPDLIPVGPHANVAGTPFDFTTAKPIGQDIGANNPQLQTGHGYDHNWVLDQTSPPSLIEAARARDPGSGRTLTVYTTEPGLQFYSGNFFAGQGVAGKSGHLYRQSAGFVLETQHFPNSPNEPSYPTTELDPGEVYSQTTIFELSNT